jgi:hypothetical protein
VDRDRLEAALADAFDADPAACRVVARQATDLAHSGRLAQDLDIELTVETVVANLQEAPDDASLCERWNWWVGAMRLTHDGYERFTVRRLD